MTVIEIIKKCGKLGIAEKRVLNDNYAEIVVFNQDLEEWLRTLMQLLGSPVKPARFNPRREHLERTEKFGGINRDQTLFEKVFTDEIVVAMLWPWKDEQRTTLKMIRLIKPSD